MGKPVDSFLPLDVQEDPDASKPKQSEDSLRHQGIDSRLLFTNNPLPMWVFDVETLSFLDVNNAAIAHYGYSRDEFLAMRLSDIRPPDDIPDLLAGLSQMKMNEINVPWQRRHLKKNGELMVVEIHAYTLEFMGRPAGLVAVHDITEQKRIEEEERRRAAHAEALSLISQAMAEMYFDYEGILNAIAQQVATFIGDACVITLLSEDTQWLNVVAFHHPDTEARDFMRRLFDSLMRRTRMQPEMSQPLLMNNAPIFMPEVSPEALREIINPNLWPYLDRFGIHSLLIVPLHAHGKVIGTLGVTRDTPGRAYTASDLTFLQSLGDRAALAIQNARLFKEVRAGQEQLRVLMKHVVYAQEDERRRISRELHDEAGQALTALKMSLQMLESDLPVELEEIRYRVGEMVNLADTTMEHIRGLAQNLRPAALDTLGLNAVLEGYCHNFAYHTRIAVEYSGMLSPDPEDTVKIYLYRFLQEALTNVARHAQANLVLVNLRYQNHKMILSVEDNGQGFDYKTIMADQSARAGIGLVGLRERLGLLNGWLEIQSNAGQGSRLTAYVPWQSPLA